MLLIEYTQKKKNGRSDQAVKVQSGGCNLEKDCKTVNIENGQNQQVEPPKNFWAEEKVREKNPLPKNWIKKIKTKTLLKWHFQKKTKGKASLCNRRCTIRNARKRAHPEGFG